MTDRTMYDSDTAADIPLTAEMVAGYPSIWKPEDFTRWNLKKTVVIRIDNHGNIPHECSVLDVESGAATVGMALAWLKERHQVHGDIGTLYCNKSTLPGLAAAVKDQPYHLWIADPTGEPHSFPGAVATQYAFPSSGSGGHYDLSLVTDDKWHPLKVPPAKVAVTHGVVVTQTGAIHRVTSEDQVTWTNIVTGS